MPLSAVHATRGVLDATDLPDEVWAEVHRRGAPLACPECTTRQFATRRLAILIRRGWRPKRQPWSVSSFC
jgi:hypothetical protein